MPENTVPKVVKKEVSGMLSLQVVVKFLVCSHGD